MPAREPPSWRAPWAGSATETRVDDRGRDGSPKLRNVTIGVFASQADAEAAIRELERDGLDMTNLSLLARGMSEERHDARESLIS
jgi:hypothetical protein